MVTRILLLALVGSPPPALGQQREVGNLITDGIPDIPSDIAEKTRRYQNTRAATLFDWAPDGSGVLIGTRFGETQQVHFVRAPLSARRQLTFFDEPVSSATYDKKKKGGFVLRMDRGGGEFYQYYWFDTTTGEARLLTDGASRNQALVAKHGGGFAFASTKRNKKDFDIYSLDAEGRAELLYEVSGQWSPIDWSPRDDKLLVSHYVSANESYLYVLDIASRVATEVNKTNPKVAINYEAAAFDGTGGGIYYASDEDSEFTRLTHYDLKTGKRTVLTASLPWDVDALAVSEDGQWLAYTANEGGASVLFVATTKAPTRASRVDLPLGVLSGLAFDPGSRRLGLSLSTADATADVYSLDLQSKRLTRWTESEVGGLDPALFVTPELVEVPSFDGKKIPAWYYRPKSASAATPVPVVVSIHGGPEAQSLANFNPTTQLFARELGFAVLLPNVRGSAGYGKTYLKLDNGDRREDAVKDIGALLDWLATRPELDKTRVAVMGGSYGGYMTLASLVHFGERLRCGVDVVGISNFVTFLESTEAYRRDLRREEYGDERNPQMRAFLTRISPTENASRIKRPLFVAQGKNDPRVPVGEAEQIVTTVRKNGTAVWYLLAKDEGHGFQKKHNRDYYLDATTLFLRQCLE